jgi:hypothetical protein
LLLQVGGVFENAFIVRVDQIQLKSDRLARYLTSDRFVSELISPPHSDRISEGNLKVYDIEALTGDIEKTYSLNTMLFLSV